MTSLKTWAAAACGIAAAFLLTGCERPPVETTQTGYRGTGMVQVVNPRIAAANAALHAAPQSTPPAPAEGPRARDVYQNVKVLGDLSVAEFTRHMVAITEWVSPQEGCNYCHNPANLADDSKYTKIVSRRMIELTQHLNVNWKDHVATTGVTCYTCHRGQPVPANVWFTPLVESPKLFIGDDAGQNKAAPQAGLSSLPYDPFTPYLSGDLPIRVAGDTALPTGNRASTKQAEFTYSLMIHMSTALGVNCTFCHNTRSLGSWDDAPPQRISAFHGIRMARDINNN
jgi:photosynthetic reaction center cytochrome c subunit